MSIMNLVPGLAPEMLRRCLLITYVVDKNMKGKTEKGVTLLELMLVLAIMGSILVLMLNYGTRQAAQQRRDKTAVQMQQILSAGLAYYLAYGSWPVPSGSCTFSSTSTNPAGTFSSLTTLITAGYLPSSFS